MNKEELLNDILNQLQTCDDQVKNPQMYIDNIIDPTLRCDLEYLLTFKVEQNIFENIYNVIIAKC